jgi:hypothetical protein
MPRPKTLDTAVLVKFDELLLRGVERERKLFTQGLRRDGTPRYLPRTGMIRTLVREGINARLVARGEEVPVLTVAEPIPEAPAPAV